MSGRSLLARSMTPPEVVEALDRYVVGQNAAKRAVAVALRNRDRRLAVDEDFRDEIVPRNILFIGPTGCGKTEIARRLASLAKAPFIKVEATRFTEVGYVGRDVESIVRDLVSASIALVRKEEQANRRPDAEAQAEERLLDLLLPPGPPGSSSGSSSRELLRKKLRAGDFDAQMVSVDLPDAAPGVPILGLGGDGGMGGAGAGMQELFDRLSPKRTKTRQMNVRDARRRLVDQALDDLVSESDVSDEGIRRAEQSGIVFLDEIDKVAARGGTQGADVSREGVQRDILPIVEGTTVTTKWGAVKTDHVLFVAAGAFHVSKPSDLIPELQGRFPVRVELQPLRKEDLRRILVEPHNALTKQYSALLATEGVELEFSTEALDRIAEIAFEVNERAENIGARRLQTVLEQLMDEIAFDAADWRGAHVVVGPEMVDERLANIVADVDLSRFIL